MDALAQNINTSINQAFQGDTAKIAARTAHVKDIEKIEKAAEEFEAVFVTEMLKPMFEGIETNDMFGGGKGEEIFRGFMLQEYGKKLAGMGTLGIADNIKAEMIRMQEEAQGAASAMSIPVAQNESLQNQTSETTPILTTSSIGEK